MRITAIEIDLAVHNKRYKELAAAIFAVEGRVKAKEVGATEELRR